MKPRDPHRWFAPSPLTGEGRGEGGDGAAGLEASLPLDFTPSPPPLPREGGGESNAAAGPSADLRPQIISALRRIQDPELPVDIYDLGLVYGIDIDDLGRVGIRMTLTAPGCPVAQTFPAQVEDAIEAIDGVTVAHVELVWDPPWDPARMTEATRLELGLT